MFTKNDLKNYLEVLGLNSTDTVFIHSSMKAIGEAEGKADTVLDVFMEYFKNGLLVLPTHTWAQMDEKYNVFDPLTEPSCVGILTNLFMKRTGVVRSLNPTHSVAACGKNASEFIEGDEKGDTPCPRTGCWGKIYDMHAKILFVGCSLKSNTMLHAVEEWNAIPERLTDHRQQLKIKLPMSGNIIARPTRRHYNPFGDVSNNYDKIENALLETGIAYTGNFGDAKTYVCDAKKMTDIVTSFLKKEPDLFVNDAAVPESWYV